jgi:hypothetical protein
MKEKLAPPDGVQGKAQPEYGSKNDKRKNIWLNETQNTLLPCAKKSPGTVKF